MDKTSIITFDGKDEVVYSESFNVYENELHIKNVLNFNFKFIFEITDPKEGQNDILIQNKDNNVTIILSKKIRNTLGGGTTKKSPIIKFDDGKILLYSLYAQTFGDNTEAVNVTVTFYLKTL